MTPEEQWDFMNQQLFKYGLGEPWELRLREIAKEVVGDDGTFGRGTIVPFRLSPCARSRLSTGGASYTTVHFTLNPDLERRRDIAQLVAEEIIRREVPW